MPNFQYNKTLFALRFRFCLEQFKQLYIAHVLNHFLGLLTKMGCRHWLDVDLVEEIVGEGGSRSSSQVHEHDSYQLVSQQNVAIQAFWSRCQPRSTLGARYFHHGKQQGSPFYHDLGLDLVGLIGHFLLVAQLLLLVVEQLLNPNLSSSHVSRKSLEEADVRMYLLVYDFSSFHPNNFRDTISWECFVKNDSVRSCFKELSILSSEQAQLHRILMFLPCFVHVLCKTRCFQVDHVRILMFFVHRIHRQKNTVCLLLKFWPPGVNPELMMECKLIAHPTW